jgi:hypothetical protein
MTRATLLAALGVATWVSGSGCSRTTELFPDLTAACEAPGPVVHLGGTDDASCAGAIASRLGRYALCTCRDLVLTGGLNVDEPPGMGGAGPPPPGAPPAAVFHTPVGTDGNLQVAGMTHIRGSLIAAGTGDALFMRSGFIQGNLHAGGELTSQAMMDLFVAGDAFAATGVSGRFAVGGALHVPDGVVVPPEVRAREVTREAVMVDPPCGCAAGPVFDVGAAVAARKTRNANDHLAFPVSLLADVESHQVLDWGCGEYYVPAISSGNGGVLEFHIHGHVGIFVDGPLTLGDNFIVMLDPGADLDLVVAGSLITTGRVFGSPASSARTRLWTAATTITLPDQVQFGAAVYAPAAVFLAGAGLTFSGTLYTGTLSVAGDVRITYDPTATGAGAACNVAAPGPVE